VQVINGRHTAVLQVRNTGAAYAGWAGFLPGTGAHVVGVFGQRHTDSGETCQRLNAARKAGDQEDRGAVQSSDHLRQNSRQRPHVGSDQRFSP
jgi:hypothetical protein